MTFKIRCYKELSRIDGYKERYEYLRVPAVVGIPTFGHDRYLNQVFYTSSLWRRVRYEVIARDLGRDLGIEGYEIHDRVYIHHMNPITADDIISSEEDVLNPEFLITVSHRTHNAIHYGDESNLVKPVIARRPGDTKLW